MFHVFQLYKSKVVASFLKNFPKNSDFLGHWHDINGRLRTVLDDVEH